MGVDFRKGEGGKIVNGVNGVDGGFAGSDLEHRTVVEK